MSELREVGINSINIPLQRTHAQFEGEPLRELTDSIARQGILVPPLVADVDGQLWLVDGQHRLEIWRALGHTTVRVMVSQGTIREVIVQNITTNRQRGKANPAEEAKLIRSLVDDEGLPEQQIASLTGLSVGWVRRLYDVSHLNPTVLDMVGQGRLGVTHAMELLRIEDEALQLEVATQAQEWHYTVEQVRLRVDVLLRPDSTPAPGSTAFDQQGAPVHVPIPCRYCLRDMTGDATYMHICGDCQARHDEMERAYTQAMRAPPAPEPAAAAAPPPSDKAANPQGP